MSVPERFGVLRFAATLLKIGAWIVLVLSVLGGLLLGVLGPLTDQGIGGALLPVLLVLGDVGGIVAGLATILLGVLLFLALYVAGEGIQVQIAIEENTRLTAALLLRLEEESQPAGVAAYPSYYAETVRE